MEIDPQNIDQMAKLTKQLIELLPEESKKNLFNPITSSVGKGASSILDLFFYPANYLNILATNKLKELHDKTSSKIATKKENGAYSEKNIGLAAKAIEESKYQLDSEILQDFFSELIANSLDKKYEDSITPYFSSILSNISPEDAVFLRKTKNYFSETKRPLVSFPNNSSMLKIPCAHYLIQTNEGSVRWGADEIIWGENQFEEYGVTISALSSFGLIQLHYTDHLLSPEYIAQYESFTKTPEYETTRVLINQANPDFHIGINKGYVGFTDLGRLFLEIVVV